ncbi:diguanylate cyclase [Oscillospiraceae bacterium Marseille-Q3528]|nr:diguanylate cyclase [Oscillospiraceae bacterium Marseille-Q3528]
MMAAILLGFLMTQFLVPSERGITDDETHITYPGIFYWEKEDGSREKIAVPGRYDVAAKETMVISTVLPADFDKTALAIRGSLQDVTFYVGDELREVYDTSDTRPFGKNSASRYVFCPTSAADAGKEVRILLRTNTSQYAGVVNAVYWGDKVDIWQYLFRCHASETIIAAFILFAGVVTILFSIALGVAYKTKFDMEYLGWCMIMGAIWMLGESKLRQLFLPNASAIASLCFVMILFCPVPILFYVDTILCGRYHRLYQIIGYIATGNLFVCSFLHMFGILDYIQTLPLGHLMLVATLAVVLITTIRTLRHSTDKADRLVLAGLIVIFITVVIETIATYYMVTISGIFLGIGLLILLFINILRTIARIRNLELERRQKEMHRRREQMEKLSLQVLRTLSTTIETKDEYTRGHSHRVGEYAALIARELGWSQEEIINLKNTADLHDIGKIGVPDTILNKPTKLTEDEYIIIKDHTVIGAEILKNITLIPHAAEVARSHHERYDGTGYPDGLKGEDIPLYARVIAVADSYDAMSSRRIYRSALSRQEICEEIRSNQGKQFDPVIAEMFLRLLTEDRLQVQEADSTTPENADQPNMEFEIGKFVSDIMQTMKAQEDSENFDFLTGLPMRNAGEKLAARLMEEHDGCLIFMDMDNLKQINDIYGHKAGDRALKVFGSILASQKADAAACRLGGDEFLLFVPDISRDASAQLVKNIFAQFQAAKESDLEIRGAAMSAGLCMTHRGQAFADCYVKADKALYYVKQNGKENFFFYQQMEQENLAQGGTSKDLATVAKALQESGTYSGALDLDYRDFAKLYAYMNQLSQRYAYHCYLVMVTMSTTPDAVMYIENIEQALSCMEQAIRRKIRAVDICTRNSSMQYLIILFESEEKQIPPIMERIFAQYYRLYGKGNFYPKYEYLPMMPPDGTDQP